MTTPKAIYLQVCGECHDNDCEECNFDDLADITWCKDRINDNDVAYISEEIVKQYAKTIDELIGRLKELTDIIEPHNK